MAEAFDTANDAIESLEGDETFDEAEYPLRDFSAKEIDVYLATRLRALEEGVVPPGSVDADAVSFTPAGTIAATDVQAAIEEVASEAGGGGGWPVRAFLIATHPPKAQSNFDNAPASVAGDGAGPFGNLTSDDANGAWIEWYVALAAGTYALTVKGWRWSGGGILRFSIDGTVITSAPYSASASDYDGYFAGGNGNEQIPTTIASDVTIPDDGVYVLRATVTGKNASSSGFATNLLYLALDMVAAA